MDNENKSRFFQFFYCESKKLINYVKKKIINIGDMDAEDIVSEVMLKIVNKADSTSTIDNLSAYVYQSIKNKITDNFRKGKKTLSLDNFTDENKQKTFLETLTDNTDITDEIERKEQNKKIYDAVNLLSTKQKAVFIATEIEGYTFKELTEKWQEPIGTLLARKSRAVKKLKKYLDK